MFFGGFRVLKYKKSTWEGLKGSVSQIIEAFLGFPLPEI